jgi:hypothetical protein
MTKVFRAVFYGERSAESGEAVNEIFSKIAEMDAEQEDGVDSPMRARSVVEPDFYSHHALLFQNKRGSQSSQ